MPVPKPVRSRKPTPPDRIVQIVEAPTLDDHLELMTRAIFQAGLSWSIIDDRWESFRAAFDAFAIAKVAAYDELDVERIMNAPGIIRSEKKITGTIENARALIALYGEFGGVAGYAASFADYAALYKDAHKRFAFLGDLSCYYWLFRTGTPVPPFEKWMERQTTDHPRMREMITLARTQGRSPELQ